MLCNILWQHVYVYIYEDLKCFEILGLWGMDRNVISEVKIGRKRLFFTVRFR